MGRDQSAGQLPILEMRKISKHFGPVTALDQVDLSVHPCEIHALIGENGAGKSSLMKILAGVYQQYEGQIFLDGKECKFRGIKDSEAVGLVVIHQELALIPELTVAENVFLGNERARRGLYNWAATQRDCIHALRKLGVELNPDSLVNTLGVAQQQMVEIARALCKKVRVLVLDEPTSALNEHDAQTLLKLLLDLKSHGVTSILITHKLNEIIQVADRVTILRDGHSVETLEVTGGNISEAQIISGMVGRPLNDRFPPSHSQVGEVVFEVRNWSVWHNEYPDRQILNNVNLTVRRGEIVGIAGLMGAGRTELVTSIFGHYYGGHSRGEIWLKGKKLLLHSVPDAIKKGLAYVTEDRKNEGLILIHPIKDNITLTALGGLSKGGMVNAQQEYLSSTDAFQQMHIKAHSVFQTADELSGGNQQKVVLAKWLLAAPVVLILDEPTRGIDVGAKYEIYSIIRQLAAEGKACLLISSELPELLGMCDRIYILAEKTVQGELTQKEASQEAIMGKIVRAVKGENA